MKKLISVVLSALLLMTSVLCVSAEKGAADIKVSTVAFDVKVEVTTDADGRMTAILRNTENNLWIDMDQTDDYEVVEGKNVYTFNFVMQPATETGSYTVTVGGCVETTALDFKFTNITNLISFYNDLDGADAEEVHELLFSDECILTYDLTAYKALDEDICEMVDAEIASWTLAADLENIAEIETAFKNGMDDLIARALVADPNTATEDWEKAINDSVKNDVLETDFMDKVDAEVVHTYFKKATLKGITAADIQVALDEAQLLAVADDLDYASLNDAFDYYLEKGIVDIKDADYNKVVAADKADNLFKKVKEMTNTTISELENNVNEVAADILADMEEDEEDDTPSRPSTSGGGGGGGGGSTRKNTTGNTMMSGDAAESTKKEEVVTYDANFSDLGEAAWAATAVTALAENGVISGRGDGKFYPNDTVTREEFVKIIVTAFDALDEDATASFDDVAADRWSYKYIATANRLGLVTGTSETTFNPTGTMTREDMAVIMHRAMKLAKLEDGAYTLDFADADEIAGYAVEAVTQLAGKNIIKGMGDNTFAPKGTVTRAQAATVVYQLLALIGGVN